MQFLILRSGILDSFHDRLQLGFRITKFVVELDDLIECRGLLFRLASLIKKCQELVPARNRLGPQCCNTIRQDLVRPTQQRPTSTDSLSSRTRAWGDSS